MTIRLLPIQKDFPSYWEVIKFATTTAEEVREKDLKPYLLWLLHLLLSDKAQCWMRLDDTRTIIAILITRFEVDKITAEKSLHLQCVYSWRHVPLEEWQKDFDFVIQFAKKENCDKITFSSRHPKIWEMLTSFGCRELHRSFVYDLR